jgi:predicted ATP-dependent serine protease
LAVAVAIASSFRNQRVQTDMAFVGEIGLSGELRSTSHLERRLGEAAKLGFQRAICPNSAADLKIDGMSVATVRSVVDAVDAALVGGSREPTTNDRRSAKARAHVSSEGERDGPDSEDGE